MVFTSQGETMAISTKNKLSLAISQALLAASLSTTYVQAAEENTAEQSDVEVIQVRGIRGSLVKSLNTKRFSGSVVDAVTAEDIGKFPDQNVAESLQRITGVSISRNFGEGERVSIRGTSESQNRTLLNGQAVGSVDWWTNSPASRGFNYTMLPSEIVSGLEVYKSPEADIDEGSIGGTVIVRTRKPLELEANKIAGSIMAQHSEVSGETDPQLSGLYSWKNEDETFGALISVVRQQRNLRRDGIESWSWTHRDIEMEDGTVHKNVYSSGGGGSAMFSQERIRTGFNASLQYRPSDALDITFNALDSTLEANNENQNFLWLPGYGGSKYQDVTIIDHDKVGKMLIAGTLGLSPDGNNILDETKVRNSELSTESYDLKADYQGDIWQTSVHLGYTKGSGGSHADRSVGWGGNYVHSYDASSVEDMKTSYSADPADGTKWSLDFLRYDQNNAKDDEHYVQVDFNRPVDVAVFSNIKFGAKYRDHSRYNEKRQTATRTDLGWSLADYSLQMPSDYLSGLGSNGTLKNYAITDSNKVRREGDALGWQYNLLKASTFEVEEQILAGYIKADIDADSLRGNLGVRLVQTNQDTGAYVGENWQTQSKDYFDVLPSLNLAIDLDDDLIMRLAAARVMSRPDYNSMTPSTSYNLETKTGTGGNPDIDPYRANQFDVSIEWYFDEASLFSAALFHKDIQSFLDSQLTLETHEGVGILVNRPVNGRSGTIQGLELAVQHDIYQGLGVMANYTYVDGEAKGPNGEDITIPGNSEHTINLSAYYENEYLNGRISYNYRTGYDTGLGWPGYVDDYGQIDANLNYNVTENVTLVFEAINLTDEHTFSYQEKGVEQALTGVYADGRRYVAGVRFNF